MSDPRTKFCLSPASLVFTRKQIHRRAGEITCEGRRQQYLITPHRLPNSSTQQRYRSRPCGLVDTAVINCLVAGSLANARISRLQIDDRTLDGILRGSITAPGECARNSIRHTSESGERSRHHRRHGRQGTSHHCRRLTALLPSPTGSYGSKSFHEHAPLHIMFAGSIIHIPCTPVSLPPLRLGVSTNVTRMSTVCRHCA